MCNIENKIKDEELLKFLKFSYFGTLTNLKEATANRAYRDMCRTIRFDGLCEDSRLNLKIEVNSELITKIENLAENFDTWHKEVCNLIVEKYKDHGIKLTYGQAQKWVNMTIKYLYILNEHTFDNVFDFLHIPVDNYIFKAAKEKLGIDNPKKPWSKLDETEYFEYQKAIREKLKEKIREKIDIDTPPLLWEFKNWLEVAKGNNKN
ncbi:hypothetical protein NM219_06250 [Parvimonas micra]|jgi:hypothetical protein|uniref:Uncharacterized protein n=1 Tax=Parvimonas micra TaxID=33033 RepID=A0A930E085_9FIRM|nr:hypothetical protein [Parvimonas micra]MBF1307364.1 hypothetical protein [Parvimonas micra]WBB33622.1 hypothetical protein NM220_06250 [Parvimonas micra]WBB35143.1 hypothetical protein NM219_06250 [Parvimonas micra]